MISFVKKIAHVTFFIFSATIVSAQQKIDDGWVYQQDEATGVTIQTMEMTLHPAAEPIPALKYRFIGDDFERLEGNAAPFYLQAMGFIDHNADREVVTQFIRNSEKAAREQGNKDYPPYLWQSTRPENLPVDEVRAYLKPLEFQQKFLAEAARRKYFNMDRQIRYEKSPVSYILPEVQQIREIVRNQSLRCRLALREDEVEQAMIILGQQYAIAEHLSQDPFIISSLVGVAVGTIGSFDALYVIQHPQAPNLYWAFAALPRPLVNMRYASGFESQFFYEQFKTMSEVDETPRNAGYWQFFIDHLVSELIPFAGDLYPDAGWDKSPEMARNAVIAAIAIAYPQARNYLIEEVGMPEAQVDAYPTAQVFFLAMKRWYERSSDDVLKWVSLSFAQGYDSPLRQSEETEFNNSRDRLGWVSLVASYTISSFQQLRVAETRLQQRIALVQTVEAIRLYGAQHNRRLPPTLSDLSLPAVNDPFNNKPLNYEFHEDHAVLSCEPLSSVQWRLVLRFATAAPSENQ